MPKHDDKTVREEGNTVYHVFQQDKEQVVQLGWGLLEYSGEAPNVLVHLLHPSLLLAFGRDRMSGSKN